MTLYKTSEEWQHYTALLLQARPTTTRIVTKYTIPPRPSKAQQTKLVSKREAYLARKAARDDSTTADSKGAAQAPAAEKSTEKSRAYLELRTYDPESGVVLKYRTDKAAEVGRLMASLGKMGRIMGALPPSDKDEQQQEDVEMADAAPAGGATATAVASGPAPSQGAGKQAVQGQQGQQGGGGGGGAKGKKKKGKR